MPGITNVGQQQINRPACRRATSSASSPLVASTTAYTAPSRAVFRMRRTSGLSAANQDCFAAAFDGPAARPYGPAHSARPHRGSGEERRAAARRGLDLHPPFACVTMRGRSRAQGRCPCPLLCGEERLEDAPRLLAMPPARVGDRDGHVVAWRQTDATARIRVGERRAAHVEAQLAADGPSITCVDGQVHDDLSS